MVPKWSFVDRFGILWACLFHQILRPAKPHKLQQVQCESLFWGSQATSFRLIIRSESYDFSNSAPSPHCLISFDDFVRKLSILEPLQNPVVGTIAHQIDLVAQEL